MDLVRNGMGGITWESDTTVQPDCHSNSTSQRKLKTCFAIWIDTISDDDE